MAVASTLMARQEFSPVTHALVGRDQHRAATIAIDDEPKEQARLLRRHWLEAERVDHDQGG